ncbi:soluble lytic murein transglycosylase-like protein [Paenibacillus forsythiae]|uniref:Soluble lytic murein transglycosylase-like protein n=1 Tax=Paenibacillus forsythiae TaxID=365616 RepID=A0ABU3H6U0_9BACL|nr:lytic transglycosylase domain-containing protein [Paenibacillus forsythiae]MDT3426532.1 soluble lytic murein transglycosylase-like protein [Paenibacillus forsythiae]
MNINPAVASQSGQLKWVNLRSSADAGVSAKNNESPASDSRFEAVLDDQSSASGEVKTRRYSSGDGLLWQKVGAAGASAISGEIEDASAWTDGTGDAAARQTGYDELIRAASSKYGVPVDLIKAVIDTESSFNPNVVSSAGAKGLMQLMDGTAEGLGVSDPFDPAQSIDGGVRYLSYQLKRFNGQEKMALAAYNAGPGRVIKLGVSSDEDLLRQLDKLPKETQAYIAKIERARAKYSV